MIAKVLEMESVWNAEKDDDPDFEPRPSQFITRQNRTWSARAGQALRSVIIAGREVPIAEDPELVREATKLAKVQSRLIQQICGSSISSISRRHGNEFFLKYVDARIAEIWRSSIAEVVPHLGGPAPITAPGAKRAIYEMLSLIAELLQNEENCSIGGIAAELQTKQLVRDEAHDETVVQMVFQLTGWLTALFDPCPELSLTHLSLRKTRHRLHRRRVARQTVIRNRSVVIADAHLPIYRLLSRFGSLLPEPECIRRSELTGGLEGGCDYIIASYVAYHNLQQVLKVKLEWVDTLNQHLEFDQSHRILRVFRLPSLCRMMYRDTEGTLLTRLYRENKDETVDEALSRNPHLLEATMEGFLAEVLLSYRLIFSRKRRSRASIGSELAAQKELWRRTGHHDPLLEILCTSPNQSPEIHELYDDLEAEDFEDYVSIDEFPFLARRLIDLQRFSMVQNPHSLRRLWNDKRNITAWFTTWAVIIIGGGTLIFQVAQLVFQIYQPFSGS